MTSTTEPDADHEESAAPLRLAVVGCGAAAEKLYLPALEQVDGVSVVLLVDREEDRAARLAEEHGVPRTAGDYRDVVGADAAVVALPHHLHAPAATRLLYAGVHVLVEKPMALSADGCDRMLEAARSSDRVLAVGQIRRMYDASRFVHDVLSSGALGRPLEFDYREGTVFDWDVASDFAFRRDAGGGVLADTGAHALDLLLWWFGDWDDVAYRDDAHGGVEADCELELSFASGVEGAVELSRRRDLRNSCRIRAEHGELEVGTGFDPEVRLRVGGRTEMKGRAARNGAGGTSMRDLFRRQLEGFRDAALTGAPPLVSGRDAREVVVLLEECRRVRERLELPWLAPGAREATAAGRAV